MRAPRAIGVLGDDLFGDKVNFYTGSLDFTQLDVSIPGNSALPVAVGRRLRPGTGVDTNGHFGNWDLDIPHLHGRFGYAGWYTGKGSNPSLRCSVFGSPPNIVSGGGGFAAADYWQGNFLYVPGHGEQEMLRRSGTNTQAPANGFTYPVLTRNNWQFRCLTSGDKEFFVAVSPEGTTYQFDWEVSRTAPSLEKSDPIAATMTSTAAPSEDAQQLRIPTDGNEPLPTPQQSISYHLDRKDVFIYPTVITDRYGNRVTYTYDAENRWQLKSIVGNDIEGSPRRISIEYVSATSTLIKSVTDGTRTWNYTYSGGNQTVLNTVTLPDNSTWDLSGMSPLLTNIEFGEGGGCEDPGMFGVMPATGSMVHPSGARGEFTITPTKHSRTAVTRDCGHDIQTGAEVVRYPKTFGTMALTRKVISGPGLPSLEWTTSYPSPGGSWAPCPVGGCVDSKIVTVTAPNGVITRHKFGTLFQINEGQVLGSDVVDSVGNPLRSTALKYQEIGLPRGVSDQARGDGLLAAKTIETATRTITQQGVVFDWNVTGFNTYAQPTIVTRSSALGSRTENTVYNNDVNKWILARVESVTVNQGSTVFVPVRNAYNVTTGNLETVSKFGKVEKRLVQNGDGTLYSSTDGKGNRTLFSAYKRGIPQTVTYADTTSESAVVDNIGNIASVADAFGTVTNYGYDAIGRLSSITPPSGDPVAYLPTTLAFAKSGAAYQDLPAGHWVQTTTTGNAVEKSFLDSMWRPVYTERYDATDRSNTLSIVKKSYDAAGKLAFESYPKRTYAATTSGTWTSYDGIGRVTEVRQDSDLGPLITTNVYGNGFVRTTIDPRKFVTTTTFQAFDEPVEDAIATITPQFSDYRVVIARDLFGKTTAITKSGAGKSATRTYVYNANQLLCKTIEPETGATLQDYDAANNVTWRASGMALPSATCDFASVPLARRMTFSFDTRNRLKDTNFGDGSKPILRTYTKDGLLETVTSGNSVWTNVYNKRRLHVSESLAHGGKNYTVVRTFDPYGSLAKLTYPISNLVVDYNPNALGQPRSAGPFATAVTYHPNGAMAGFTYGNGIKHTLVQNERGLPKISTDATVLSDEYSYDENANITAIKDTFKSITTRSMTYDPLNRLETTTAAGQWGEARYTYDALDNLTSVTVGKGTTARSTVHAFDATTNRLQNISGTAPYNLAFSYDVQGNITIRGAQKYTFDMGNRMTEAVGRATYAYDGFGHRYSVVGTDMVNRVQVYTQAGQLLYTAPTAGIGTHYIYLGRHQVAEVKK